MLILTPVRKKTGFNGQRQHKWTFTSLSQASDPWSSESSTTYVTLQLIPGQNSFDWGESLEPGPDSEEFLLPPVHPTPPEKKVGFKILLGHFKHWNRDFVLKKNFNFRLFPKSSSPFGNLGTIWWGLKMRREPNHRVERKRRLWRKRSTRVHRNPVQHHQVNGCVLFKTSELRLVSEVGFTTLKCFYYWMNSSKCVNRPWCMSYLEISIILYSLRITGKRGHAIALQALYGISLLHRVGFLLPLLSHSLFVYPQLSSYHNKS